MSNGLRPAELWRMVFAAVPAIPFVFLLVHILEPDANPPHPVTKPQIQGGISKPSLEQSQKQPAASVVSKTPAPVSPSYMQIRLEQIAAEARERVVQFDPQPFERRLDAAAFVGAEAAVKPASAEIFRPQSTGEGLIAGASAEAPSISYQDTEVPGKPSAVRDDDESKEASVSAHASTYDSLQIKSRLRELGYMSGANGREDRRARDALRDFKVVNGLPNDDRLDPPTSDKLASETAIRADQSIVGTWSTAPCQSRKNTDTRLSLSSRGAKSSEGSICEFSELRSKKDEWRVRAKCSKGNQRWDAKGKFALSASKLVWSSDSDVISYFRCN
jgi:hypothetical protein